MIYWDNAATTWPKPAKVRQAVGQALRVYGANPGRGGHPMALSTSEQIFACRQAAADFFGLSDPSGVIFTLNCTTALNTVIRGLLEQGGRALTSDVEHNAVWRPLTALSPHYPRFDMAAWSEDEEETVENFRRAIRPDTRLIVCTHASNVFGVTLPIRRLGKLARDHGLLFCVDAAQTAGVLPIDMERDGIDYLCVAPHKGLYAPMGTGLLLCRERERVAPLVRGGTGSYSLSAAQPADLPDRLESGTPNTAGICGIHAGIQFVQEQGRDSVYRHELGLLNRVFKRLDGCEGICLYTSFPRYGRAAPVLSLNVAGLPSEETARLLAQEGVAVRAGLHCAPQAHRRFGTEATGTVRLAPCIFSTEQETEKICKLFSQIAQKRLHSGKIMV
ncbi:MAG: aminotransferase class V-fold PLP-dependent enzyme [Clostridia bacterium]|nr:aminotransferase class V-fold PLP-dependent enzyme [Clostridia bacterium]